MYLCNLFYERFLVPRRFRSYQSTLKGSTEYFCQIFREQTVTASPGRSRSVPVGHGLSRSVTVCPGRSRSVPVGHGLSRSVFSRTPHIHLHHLHYATANGTCMPRSKNPTRESCVCAQATFDGDTKSNPYVPYREKPYVDSESSTPWFKIGSNVTF